MTEAILRKANLFISVFSQKRESDGARLFVFSNKIKELVVFEAWHKSC